MSYRPFWLSLLLAIVCIVMFASAYYSLFEAKRVHPGSAFGVFWLFGSPVVVGGIAAGVSWSVSPQSGRSARVHAVVGALLVAGVYLYALMFVALNTLGS